MSKHNQNRALPAMRVARKTAVALSALSMGLLSAPAWADDPAPADEQASNPNDIIVTATKREVRLNELPASVSVIGESRLKALGADDFQGFARTVPGLSSFEFLPGKKKIIIRGASDSYDFGDTEATVALYLDDVALTSSVTAPDLHVFDIQRVEVLRGPQGTLFGSGSLGGAVRLITNRADTHDVSATFEGTLSSTRHGAENGIVNAMVNLPLVTDKVAIRAVGYYKDYGGFVDNIALGQQNWNTNVVKGGRLATTLTPSDRLDIHTTLIYQDTETKGTGRYNPALGDLKIDIPVPERMKEKLFIASANADYQFDGPTLSLVGTYYHNSNDWTFEYSENAALILGFPSAIFASPHQYNEKFKQFSGEIRLASDGESAFNYIVGAYFSDEKVDHQQIVQIIGLGPFDVPGGENDIGEDVIFDNHLNSSNRQYALFGELSYKITDALEVSAGGRLFKYSLGGDGVSRGLANGGVTVRPYRTTKTTDFNPKLRLSYKPGTDQIIYLQAAKGFRTGGTNTRNDLSDPNHLVPVEYGSDSLWNYELGWRAGFLDGAVALNAAVYYTDWKNIQSKLLLDTGFGFIGNAGAANIYGAELEVNARLAKGLTFDGSFAYTDAKISGDKLVAVGASDGDRLLAVPRVTLSTGLQYVTPVNDDLDLSLRIDHQYVSKSYGTYNEDPATRIGGFNMVNAKVGLQRERWDLNLFVNNLFDVRARMYAQKYLTERVYVARPRTIGVGFSVRY